MSRKECNKGVSETFQWVKTSGFSSTVPECWKDRTDFHDMFYHVCSHMPHVYANSCTWAYMGEHMCTYTYTDVGIQKYLNIFKQFRYNMWLQKHCVEYVLSCYDLMSVLPINCFLSPTFQEIQSLTKNLLDTHQEPNFFSLLWKHYILLTMTSTLS